MFAKNIFIYFCDEKAKNSSAKNKRAFSYNLIISQFISQTNFDAT
jgi:hypothetical protein